VPAATLSSAAQDYLKAVLALSLMGSPVTSGAVARRLHVATRLLPSRGTG
jgi:Mn-dependent DtxR family transcriptional regulator